MQKKTSSIPFLPIIIILAVIGGGLFFLFKPQQDTFLVPAPESQEYASQLSNLGKIDSPEKQEITANLSTPAVDEQETPLRKAPMQVSLSNPCLEATERLDLFFSYLDEQEYIQQYQFPQASKEIVSTLLNTLLDSPPAIKGKNISSTDIIRNATHIYRTLGPQNLSILFKIINNEADLMEETCGSFHEWFVISTKCHNQPYPLRPSLESLYEYASFFLKTSGGQAYLTRRESHLRLLAQYYSVLIIHQADQKHLNKYNISVATLLPHLISEMEGSDDLAGKNGYLAALYDIRKQLSEIAGRL